MKNILLLCGLLLLCSFTAVNAQVGEVGGPIVSIDFEPVCDDGTSVFHVLMYVVGESIPRSLGYRTGDNAAYTPTGTPTAGPCAGDAATAAPDYNFNVSTLCDGNSTFYRVAVFTDGSPTATVTEDFALDFSTSYTPSGTVYSGPCVATVVSTVTRSIATSTGSVAAGALSYEICNEGVNNAIVTVGGTATVMIPGSCTSFSSTYVPSLREYRTGPAVAYDATGTTLVIVVEN